MDCRIPIEQENCIGSVGPDGDSNERREGEYEFQLFTPKPGTNRVRLMANNIAEVKVHFEPHLRDRSIKRFTCAGEGVCVFCALANRSKPKDLWSVPIIDRADGVVKIWDFTNWSLRQEIDRLAAEVGDLTSCDLLVERGGEGRQARYRVSVATDSHPLTDEERAAELPDIEDHLRVETFEDIFKRLGG